MPVLSWLLLARRQGRGRDAAPQHGTHPRRHGLARQQHAGGRFQPPACRTAHLAAAPRAQPLEPILFPKLRIYFVDFPYLHYSIDQRLLTLETCCGYEYDLARQYCAFPRIFKDQPLRSGHLKKQGALPTL